MFKLKCLLQYLRIIRIFAVKKTRSPEALRSGVFLLSRDNARHLLRSGLASVDNTMPPKGPKEGKGASVNSKLKNTDIIV